MVQQSDSKITVLLAEDHSVTRLGIKFVLESCSDLQLIAEAANGSEALELAMSKKPDVIILDVEMPVMDGIAAAREIRKARPEAKIVMLTAHTDDEQIFAALSAGANGYCVKNISDERLHTAILSVHSGDTWLDAEIASKVIKALPTTNSQSADAQDSLSERELEVLRLIVDGLANHQIAQKLFISSDTVKTHIKKILSKLSVTDRTQAAVKALKQGLI